MAKAPTRITSAAIRTRKGGEPIACLTAYTTPIARLVDEHCDLLLVGDSLGMVVYGLPSTIGVTMEMMIAHGQAAMRGANRACVVVDMPFGSYEESPAQAMRNAARIMAETGCQAVKLEGGEAMAPTIRFLTERSVPVMAHIGLRPQAVNTFGGYKVQGRDEASRAQVMADARAVSDAGAFSVVIEKTAEDVSREITAAIPIPTVGIGASMACDGQILVVDDILGMFTDFRPKFAKPYAELAVTAGEAIKAYADDVRAGRFPGPEHVFAPKR
ncbi:MAG: 3-methyl-2-oxobutanoate hydroxymethyltransferase [Alphaproteobacteria bacterium]|nr:3-methyl-2-oxobutanoate hydroxymethyltransferase [Alphaproteobacteria bacterium]MCB9930428.1 3-methyl-2-oxobutanoate hydroxymethyltransferase [Alphaproteobacteria bacterium]